MTPQWKWDVRFLNLASEISTWSKDPSTKCGAVIVDADRRVVATGYNGFPRGVDDNDIRYNNREEKYRYVVHAEANAILNAVASVKGGTLYVNPMQPCQECAKLIVQSGIKRVVTLLPSPERKLRWRESFAAAATMFEEAGVEVDFA